MSSDHFENLHLLFPNYDEIKREFIEACAAANWNEVQHLGQLSLLFCDNALFGDNWQPIHYAVRIADVECVRMLLQHPHIDAGAKTTKNCTALHIACKTKDIPFEIVQLLVEKDNKLVECMAYKDSIICMSIRYERLDIVQLLVEQDLNYSSCPESNILFSAVHNTQPDIFKYLLYKTDYKLDEKTFAAVLNKCIFGDCLLRTINTENPFHKYAIDTIKLLWTPEMSFECIQETLKYCFQHLEIEVLDAIINKIYLDSNANERFVPVIQKLLAYTNSMETILIYYLIMPLHQSVQWLISNVIQLNLFPGLFKLFQQNRSLFDLYMPQLMSQVTNQYARKSGLYVLLLHFLMTSDTDVNPLTELSILFCSEFTNVYEFDLDWAFNYLSEYKPCMKHNPKYTKAEDTFMLLIRWSTLKEPYNAKMCAQTFCCRENENEVENGFPTRRCFVDPELVPDGTSTLLSLCRTRIRELVFKANGNLSNSNKIIKLQSLSLPGSLNNYLRYIQQ